MDLDQLTDAAEMILVIAVVVILYLLIYVNLCAEYNVPLW